MSGQALPNPKDDRTQARWWTIAMVASAMLLVFVLVIAARRSRPVEETVTLSQSPQHRATVGRPISTGDLPQARDRDLESLGDHIAQAAVYLQSRQRAAALRAVADAEAATRQLRNSRPDVDQQVLISAENELTAIEREIQRGNPEAARTRLLQLGRTVDGVGQTR